MSRRNLFHPGGITRFLTALAAVIGLIFLTTLGLEALYHFSTGGQITPEGHRWLQTFACLFWVCIAAYLNDDILV